MLTYNLLYQFPDLLALERQCSDRCVAQVQPVARRRLQERGRIELGRLGQRRAQAPPGSRSGLTGSTSPMMARRRTMEPVRLTSVARAS